MLLVTQKLKQEFWKCLYVVFPKQLLERFVDLKSRISDDFVHIGIFRFNYEYNTEDSFGLEIPT